LKSEKTVAIVVIAIIAKYIKSSKEKDGKVRKQFQVFPEKEHLLA